MRRSSTKESSAQCTHSLLALIGSRIALGKLLNIDDCAEQIAKKTYDDEDEAKINVQENC